MELLKELLHLLSENWYLGLILCGVMEGSSIPFPGQIIIFYIGHIIVNIEKANIFVPSIYLSLAYTIGTYLPYYIGYKYGTSLPPRNSSRFYKYIKKGSYLFSKYGDMAVFLSRPFVIGNYISYLAGMYKMNLVRHFYLTFLGIYIWSIGSLYIGAKLELTFTIFINLVIQNLENSIFIGLAVLIIIGIISIYMFLPKRSN